MSDVSKLKHPWTPWSFVVSLQDQLHPGWRKNKPRTLFTTGLASEVGGVCDQVTHLDGGGSQLPDPKKWNEHKILHELVDSWVMLVLVAERSGFTEADFLTEWEFVKHELTDRAVDRLEAMVSKSSNKSCAEAETT